MRSLTFRAATEADLDRLIEIHTSAFPDSRGAEPRRRNFVANLLGPLEALRVAVRGSAVVAHAFLFALEATFGGARVKLGAIATVGVAPEARGEGVGAALLDRLHADAAARGDAITLLYPFRQGFYARHGYASVTPMRRLALHPASIPRAWRSDAYVIRAAAGDDRDGIVRAYERAALRATGFLARPEALWSRAFQNERRVWLVAEQGGAIAGYVAWSLVQAEAHARTQLTIRELVADDDAIRRALLAHVGAQRDQVAEVVLEIDALDPLDRALVDLDRDRYGTEEVEHTLGALVSGPMVRIADVSRAIEARGYAQDGALDIAVDGAPLHVAIRGGRATVTPSSVEGGEGTSPLAMDRTTLAAILYGALAPSDAVRLGMLAAPRATLASADALLALPPYHALDAF